MHHLVPRSHKGTQTVRIHRICHAKIHSFFSEKELAQWYHTADRLRAHAEIQKCVAWVKKKYPEYSEEEIADAINGANVNTHEINDAQQIALQYATK